MHQAIDTRTKTGYIIGWISITLNILLFAAKFYAGESSGSVSMKADAWHTLSDSLTSLIVIIGFWLASKPPDKEHPFGHGRAESIGALVIAVMLAIVGINFFVESIVRLKSYEQPDFNLTGIIIFAASIFLKELMAQASIIAGRKINSPALIADGWHHRSDAFTSVLIVAGALYGGSLWWFDGAMGILLALLIVYTAAGIFKSSADNLLGAKIDPKLKESIINTIRTLDAGIGDIHKILLHSYGEHKEMTFHIRLPEDLSVSSAHNIASAVEREIKKQFNINTTVHIEPLESENSSGQK